jgi:hypothetical protein
MGAFRRMKLIKAEQKRALHTYPIYVMLPAAVTNEGFVVGMH